jgi:hypothetical protein
MLRECKKATAESISETVLAVGARIHSMNWIDELVERSRGRDGDSSTRTCLFLLTSVGLRDSVFGMSREKVKEITTPAQLRYYEEFVVHTEHIVQPDDIVMAAQLPEDIDLFL